MRKLHRDAVRRDLLNFLSSLKNARVMKCSRCGAVIAKIEKGMFDIFNCSWRCERCGTLWLSSDLWVIEGDVITPYRSGDEDERF